jgi:hypothetical protein
LSRRIREAQLRHSLGLGLRAGVIPLTCCVCLTILLSHRASQVLNS